MEDGIDGNDDYVENVTVDKGVKIRGDASSPLLPVVRALDGSLDVFDVTVNGAEIRGLRIYGSETGRAILLNNVSECLIRGNSFGMLDPSKRNYRGILVMGGNRNILRDNAVEYNTIGIDLFGSSGNVVYDNSVMVNRTGIAITQTGSANLIIGNTVQYNTDAGNGVGVRFGAMTDQNIISGNTIHGNNIGMDLDGMADGIITSNHFLGNAMGLRIPSYALPNDIFMNDFDNSMELDSAATGYALGSPMPLFYEFSSRFFKQLTGNHYSDYSGGDAQNDGIGDTPYSSPGYRDDSPLTQPIASYGLHGWYLYPAEGGIVLNDEDLGGPGEVVTLPAHSTTVVPSAHSLDFPVVFTGGSAAAQTTWNGWLTFASPPAAEHTVVLTFGESVGEPATFRASNATANVTGNGSDHILPFTASSGVFMVPEHGRLAVRLENTGDAALELMAGGAAGMFFAPSGSHRGGHLPPLLLLLD
jgi:parallel beta-helix repeat protein